MKRRWILLGVGLAVSAIYGLIYLARDILGKTGPQFHDYKPYALANIFCKTADGKLQHENFLSPLEIRDNKFVVKYSFNSPNDNYYKSVEHEELKQLITKSLTEWSSFFIFEEDQIPSPSLRIVLSTQQARFAIAGGEIPVLMHYNVEHPEQAMIVLNSAKMEKFLDVTNNSLHNIVTSRFAIIIGFNNLDEVLLTHPEIKKLIKPGTEPGILAKDYPSVQVIRMFNLINEQSMVVSLLVDDQNHLGPFDREVMEALLKIYRKKEAKKSGYNSHDFNGIEIFTAPNNKTWAQLASPSSGSRGR